MTKNLLICDLTQSWSPTGGGGAEADFLLLFVPFVAVGVLVPAMSTWRLIAFYLPLAGAALVFFVLRRKEPRSLTKEDSAAYGAGPPQSNPAE